MDDFLADKNNIARKIPSTALYGYTSTRGEYDHQCCPAIRTECDIAHEL